MIWFNNTLKTSDIAHLGKGNMGEHIGMEFVELGPDFVKARLPIDHRTIQPFGILHGGASCVLAETLGSVASYLVIDASKQIAMGLEINANHIRSAQKGFVTGIARPIHLGKATHVWDIRITDDEERLICVCRLTVVVLEKKV